MIIIIRNRPTKTVFKHCLPIRNGSKTILTVNPSIALYSIISHQLIYS